MKKHLGICLLRYLIALLLGFSLSFAYAPTNYGFIAWIFPASLVGLIWSIPKDEKNWKKNWGRGFRLAFIAGFGFWVRDASFIGAVSVQGKWFIASIVAVYLSLFFALYGGWAATLGRWKIEAWGESAEERAGKPKPAYAINILLLSAMHGFMWCGLEWLRGVGRVSFGWDGLGVSLIDSGFIMAQSADLFGVNALSFLFVFGGVVVVQSARSFHLEAQFGYRRAHWEVGVMLSLLCLNFLYGNFRLSQVRATETVEVNTLILQQNLSLFEAQNKSDEVFQLYADDLSAAFARIEERAVKGLEESGEVQVNIPDIVVFPENALPYPVWIDENAIPIADQPNHNFHRQLREEFPYFLFISGITQFEGFVDQNDLIQTNLDGSFHNSVAVFQEDFLTHQSRAKNHLMPFGEYIPLEGLMVPIYEFFSGFPYGGAFHSGSDFQPMKVTIKGQPFSVIPTVCYEDSVPSVPRKYVRNEPQFIVNVTNDGWFEGTHCAEKHFQNARFRTIECRRPLIRAANTGLSGVIHSSGSHLHPVTNNPQELRDASGNYEIRGSLEAVMSIPTQPIFTLYSVIGDLFCWGGGGAVVIWSLLRLARRKNSRDNVVKKH